MDTSSNFGQKAKSSRLFTFGLLELGFVVLILFILFAVLNYFSILNLSQAFPILSFLPHVTKESNKIIPNPISSHTPSSKVPIFNYDNAKANTSLTSFMKSVLKPEFSPQGEKLQQIQSAPNGFSMDWNSADTTFETVTYFTPYTNTVQNLHLTARITNQPLSPIGTATRAQEISSIYVQKLPGAGSWTCTQDAYHTSCQQIANTKDAKQGVGVLWQKSAIIVSVCSIPKTSNLFTYTSNCLAL